MEKGIGSLIAVVFVVGLVLGGRALGRSSASAEYKKEAIALMQHVEGYSANPDYFHWLAEFAHEVVFDDCCTRVRTGRRSSRIVVDEEKYFYNMLTEAMMQAGRDNAPHICTALQTFRDENYIAPDASPQQRRLFYMQQEERDRAALQGGGGN